MSTAIDRTATLLNVLPTPGFCFNFKLGRVDNNMLEVPKKILIVISYIIQLKSMFHNLGSQV